MSPLPYEPHHKATSRNKRKCKRGRKVQPDHKRADLPPPQTQQVETLVAALNRLHPKSRNKRRCWFGPQSRRGRSRERQDHQKVRARSSPIRPVHRRWDAASHWLPDDPYADVPPEPEELSNFPARPTLVPPAFIRRTPFDHYKAGPSPAPSEDPYKFIHRKLGVSAQTFQERLTQEVEELLQEFAEERAALETNKQREAEETIQGAGPSEHVLSKDECYQLLRGKELTTGSLLGNFRWAADLGRAKWNFEMPN